MVKVITRPKTGGAGREPPRSRTSKLGAPKGAPGHVTVDSRPFIEKRPASFTNIPRFTTATVAPSSLSPAVKAVALAGLGSTVLVGLPAVAHAQDLPPTNEMTRAQLEDAIARLELRRGDMTPEELAAERARLWHLYVRSGGLAGTENLPRTEPSNTNTSETRTRGEIRLERLANDIEYEMRITARDMATRDFVPIDGLAGYKELSGERVRELIVSALKDIPLNELPGGSLLASLVRQLPNTSNLNIENMTYRELQDAVGDSQKEWLEARFRPVFDEHKIEAAVVAFGSITAIRYTSPDAARTLDRVLPRIGIYDRDLLGDTTRLEADLRYRNAEVLPNLDLRVRSRYPLNESTTARLDAEATLSVENDRHVSGRITGGVRWVEGSTWVDGSAYVTDTGRYGGGVEAGTSHLPSGLNARAYVHSHFGEGTATGDASGRVMYGVDLTRDVNINGARGNFGVYVGGGVDTDGSRNDINAGVVFTLRW